MHSTTKNHQSRDRIDRMARKAFDGIGVAEHPDAVIEVKDGWFNAAYFVALADGRDVVLKIAPPPSAEVLTYEQDIMTTEVETMRLVARNPRIPVPRVFAHDASRELCDAPYFFMARLGGVCLHHVSATLDPDMQATIRRQIGEIMREVNEHTGPYFGYPGNEALRASDWRTAFRLIVDSVIADGARKHVDYRFDVNEIRQTIERHASTLDDVTVPRLVHWDAWDPNIFVIDGTVTGIIDFERCLWGDPIHEAHFRRFFPTDRDILVGYGRTTLSDSEEVRSSLYSLHLGLVMLTETPYRGYTDDFIPSMGHRFLGEAMRALR